MKERLLKRFEDEVMSLERELKMELPKEIQRARELGDLRENAEYQAAKERQSFIEGRILELETKLANAQIIDPKHVDADGRCVFGATVELADLESGEAVTYQIVGEDEADARASLELDGHRVHGGERGAYRAGREPGPPAQIELRPRAVRAEPSAHEGRSGVGRCDGLLVLAQPGARGSPAVLARDPGAAGTCAHELSLGCEKREHARARARLHRPPADPQLDLRRQERRRDRSTAGNCYRSSASAEFRTIAVLAFTLMWL